MTLQKLVKLVNLKEKMKHKWKFKKPYCRFLGYRLKAGRYYIKIRVDYTFPIFRRIIDMSYVKGDINITITVRGGRQITEHRLNFLDADIKNGFGEHVTIYDVINAKRNGTFKNDKDEKNFIRKRQQK